MNTFLKVVLVAAILVIAIKISPVLFLGAFVGLIVAAVLGVIGISLIAGLAAVVLSLAVALAPIWIPIVCIVGIISLCRKNERPPVVTT